MAPGRIRRFLSRLGRVFRRRRSREQDRGRIQQCSDHDGTHSSEMPWRSQASSHEAVQEVGDRHPSICVPNNNYLEEGIKANNRQVVGGCLGDRDSCTSSVVQESSSGDKVGCLGDRDSCTSSAAQESSSGQEDGYLGDGDSCKDSDLNALEERIPPVGEEQPSPPGNRFPLKKEVSLPPKQQDDNLFCPQIPKQSPEKPLSSEVQLLRVHNLQNYSNLTSPQQHLRLGELQVLIDKNIPPKDRGSHELDLSSIPSPRDPTPHEKFERPSRKRRRLSASSPPENRSERPSHEQRRQVPRSESGKLLKNCSTKQGKKCRSQRRKKKHSQGRKSHGNSSGKGKTPNFASKSQRQSPAQSHTSKGCGNVCKGHVTKRKKHLQRGYGSSSSGDSKKSSESETENDSSRSSSDSMNQRSKRTRTRKEKPGDQREEKEKSSDSDSSGKFETAPEEEDAATINHVSQDPMVGFVAGSDFEQHLKSEDKSPDRKSLDSFTSDAISQQSTSQIQDHPKPSTPVQLDNTHPTQGLQLSDVIAEVSLDLDETPSQQAFTESATAEVPSSEVTMEVVVNQPNLALIRPEVKAPSLPDSAAENKQKSLEIGGSSKTKPSESPQSKPLVGRSDLPPVWNPFLWQAGEEHIPQPQLIPSRTMTLRDRELHLQLACSGIMPIHIHFGRQPCGIQVEEVLAVCAVGDPTLLLNAVKILGTILYCKLSFIQCGQPSASIIPTVMVDCQEEDEWSLVICIDVTTRDAETFRSFRREICRLISNLLEKWQAFHSTEKCPPNQLVSLLECLRSTIEQTLLSECDEPGAEPSRLLNYLVFELLTPLL